MSGADARTARGRGWLWTTALIVSAGLLVLVLVQIDWSAFPSLLAEIGWPPIVLAGALLLAEGVVTALRLRLFAGQGGGGPPLSAALRANAWYVLLLVTLPARLGELAAVAVLRAELGQTTGAAAISLLAQRLFDVALLAGLFLVALLGLPSMGASSDPSPATGPSWPGLALAGILVVLGVAAGLARLDLWLRLAAALLTRYGPHAALPRTLLRVVLQARRWAERHWSRGLVAPALGLTLAKWGCNLGALVALLAAGGSGLSELELIVVAASYNGLAVVPLQTVGGIGLGEAGLMGLLAAFGVPLAAAAAVALVTRMVVIVAALAFWVLVIGGGRLLGACVPRYARP